MSVNKRKNFLPFHVPSIGNEEISAVTYTLKSGWLTTGPRTKEFEKEFAKYIGCKYAVALNSCTAALHLSLLAHGVGPGDEVILPSFTFASTANVVVNVGADPVFADIREDTFNINPSDIVKNISKRTKAIIVVHYAGHPVEIDEIQDISKRHDLAIIEDAAHAVGAYYKGKNIGSLGNTTCFSFYATKNLTTGEGGMLTTNNAKIAKFVARNSLHGISKDAWKRYSEDGSWRYKVEYSGWKYNMTDIQAALGIQQLKKLDNFIEIRNSYVKIYDKELSKIDGVKIPIRRDNVKHAYHLYPILLAKFSRDKFIQQMKKRNIGTSVHFLPLHLQPFYKKTFGYKKRDLPVTEMISEHIVSLPLYPSMKEDDIHYVVSSIQKIVR